jgi:bisphosphoglycerate-dependent phosphoglycerate mutase
MELEHLNAQEIASVEVANGVPIVFDAQAGTTEFVRRNSR